MVILEDTRQQANKHELKHDYFAEQGIEVYRTKLPFGDYAIWGRPVSVDTKKDIYELAQDIDADHSRFRAECINSRNAGCQLIILVENVDGVDGFESLMVWQEDSDHFRMRQHKSKKKGRLITGERLAKACLTMGKKYGVQFRFCRPDEAGQKIVELLTNEK